MPLLNYTTTVAATKTIGEVQRMLARAGATQIMSNFDGRGAVTGMAFLIETPLGPRGFKLPVQTERVEAVLKHQRVAPRYRGVEQAERVAWRIVKDWLEAQLAIIETEMVTFDQVMLPYMTDDRGQTVYELYLDRQLALEGPR